MLGPGPPPPPSACAKAASQRARSGRRERRSLAAAWSCLRASSCPLRLASTRATCAAVKAASVRLPPALVEELQEGLEIGRLPHLRPDSATSCVPAHRSPYPTESTPALLKPPQPRGVGVDVGGEPAGALVSSRQQQVGPPCLMPYALCLMPYALCLMPYAMSMYTVAAYWRERGPCPSAAPSAVICDPPGTPLAAGEAPGVEKCPKTDSIRIRSLNRTRTPHTACTLHAST